MNIIVAASTYSRMKVTRGDWYGETISKTRDHLWHFSAWLPKAVAIDVRRVKRAHIQNWVDSNPRHSNAHKRVRLVAVRGLFAWLHQEGHIGRNPAIGVTYGTIPESVPRSFTDEEVELLFATAARDPRESLCCGLLWNEGSRRSEVGKMLLEDINWRGSTAWVRGKRYRGDTSRNVAISPETMGFMKAYLAAEPPPTGLVGPLVRSRRVGRSHEGLTSHGIGQIVDKVVKDAGLKWFPWDGRSSHAGRHTSATFSIEEGVEPELIKRQHGWVSDAMLRRYSKGAALPLHEIHRARAERRKRLADRPAPPEAEAS